MPDSVYLTHSFQDTSRLAEELIEQGARAVTEAMENIADDVVNEVNQIIRKELINDRSGYRSKGGEHLLGSIQSEVTSGGSSFPVTIAVWSDSDEDAKVNSLEAGSRPHVITAVNAPFLVFPSNRTSRAAGASRGVFGKAYQAGGGSQPKNLAAFGVKQKSKSRGGTSEKLVRTKSVNHPGNKAYRFLQRGLERAVRKALG